MKRVIIVHGWSGHPKEAWFPWMKKELEKRGFNVEVPKMPNTDHPKIKSWVPFLAKIVGKSNKDTYLVGHSIGCQTILRYLASLPKDVKIGGVLFVAGWFKLSNLGTEEERKVAKPWLNTAINFAKVRLHTKKFAAIFSDNDPYVPLENVKMFKEKLGAKTIMVRKKGHMGGDDKVTKLPIALKELLKMTR